MMPKNFLFVLILNVIINTGMGIIMPILPILLTDYGFSIAGLSAPFLVLILARLLSKFYSGKIINYFGNKNVLMFSFIIYALTFFMYSFIRTKEAFIIIRFFEGIVEGIAIVSLTEMAIVFADKNKGKLMGYFGSSFGLGFILGPAIGGIMYDIFGKNIMFLSGGLIGILGFILALSLPKTTTQKEVQNITPNIIKMGLQYLVYLKYYGPSIVRRATLFSFMIILPLYLVSTFGTSSSSVSAFFSTSAIITTLLMPFTGKLADKYNPAVIVCISLGIMGFMISLFGIANNITIFTIFFIIETLTFAFMLPAGMKLFAESIKDHPRRTNIIGFFGGLTELTTLIIAILLPLVYSFDYKIAWVCVGLFCITFAIPFIKISTYDRQNI